MLVCYFSLHTHVLLPTQHVQVLVDYCTLYPSTVVGAATAAIAIPTLFGEQANNSKATYTHLVLLSAYVSCVQYRNAYYHA